MATYFVASGGSNTSPYDTWAKAATSLATALAAATTNGDQVIIQHNGIPSTDKEVAAAITYTFAANVALISASADDAGTAWTPTSMGTDNWIGNSTTNRTIGTGGAFTCLIHGVTLRTAGGTAASIFLSNTEGAHHEFENCYLWNGNANTTSTIRVGSSDNPGFARLKNTTVRFGATAQSILVTGALEWEGGTLSSDGSSPTSLISFAITDSAGSWANVTGVDLSHGGANSLLKDSGTTASGRAVFSNCKMGSGFVGIVAQTYANLSGSSCILFNCAAGDEHFHIAHYDELGSTTCVTSPYVSDGALYDGTNPVTWKITTTAAASYFVPYVSPWMEQYHSGTSAITPFIEGLRTSSANSYDDTVAQNDEIWAEFSYQQTASSTQATIDRTDEKALNAAAANQTSAKSATTDWTGELTYKSTFKLTGASITPAEIGMLRARVCVGEPSKTFYVDPTIRT